MAKYEVVMQFSRLPAGQARRHHLRAQTTDGAKREALQWYVKANEEMSYLGNLTYIGIVERSSRFKNTLLAIKGGKPVWSGWL